MAQVEWRGSYLDGRTPASRAVTVRILPGALALALDGGGEVWWPLAEVRQTQGFHPGEHVRLERGQGVPEALVVVDQRFLTSLRELAPATGGRFVDPTQRRRRTALVVGLALAGIGLVAGLYFVGIPALARVAAARVPPSWEARLGATVADQIAPPSSRCTDAAGRRALDRLVRRLVDNLGPTPYTFRVEVGRDETVNALAAPGGHIVVLKGLLDFAESPEEVAGVLAHELQHVVRRHATKAIIEQAGLAVLVTAVTGDPTGAAAIGAQAAQTLASARYTRVAEDEADREGMRLVLAAHVDPRGMIAFFERMGQAEGREARVLAFLSTHPRSADRVRTLRGLAGAAPAPGTLVLDAAEWDALKKVCG